MRGVKATGLMGDGDEESHVSTLLDSLRGLGSQDFVEESSRAAKRRGEARSECPMPLADLGRRAWPRDPGQVCREGFAELAGLRSLLVDLEWRMVDFVAAHVQGRAAFQISVPLLDPHAWLRVAELPDLGCGCNWRMVPRSISAADGVRPLRLGSVQGHMPIRRRPHHMP